MTGGGGSLRPTGRSSVPKLEWSGSLNVSLAGRAPMWCFVQMLRSQGTAYNVPWRPSKNSRMPRVFVNGVGFRTREVSRTLPVRYVDEVARLGTLSPLGGHSRDNPEEQDGSRSVAVFGRAADFEEVSTRYGVSLDSQGLRTRRTSMRASSPEAIEVEECVGAIRRLPAAWGNPSRWHTIIEGNFKFTEAVHMKEGRAALMGLRRAGAGTTGHGHRFLSLTDNMSKPACF